MTAVNITEVSSTVVVTENGSSTVVTVPQTSVVTAITVGPQGATGAAASSYIYTQSTPSATWTIAHNLGFKPSVELLNAGSQEIEGDVVHISYDVTMVYFTQSTAGFARLN